MTVDQYDLDYETESKADIELVGAFEYAAHESTRITVFAIAKNFGEPLRWHRYGSEADNKPAWDMLLEATKNGIIWAHIVLFEAAISNARMLADLGITPPELHQWRCTAALCRVAGFASGLGMAAKQLLPEVRKDTRGEHLIKVFCCPDKEGNLRNPMETCRPKFTTRPLRKSPAHVDMPASIYEWVYDAAPTVQETARKIAEYYPKATAARIMKVAEMLLSDMEALRLEAGGVVLEGARVPYPKAWDMFVDYCVQDVRTQQALRKKLQPDFEPKDWLLDSFLADLGVNIRGIAVDRKGVMNAITILAENQGPLEAEFTKLTGLTPTQGQKFLAWSKERGYEANDLQEQTVTEQMPNMDPASDLYRAHYLRSMVSFSALKKYPKMEAMSRHDGRVRGVFQWYGAQRTGRDSGKDIQPQNFRSPDDGEEHDLAYWMVHHGATARGMREFSKVLDSPSLQNPHEALAFSLRHFCREPDCGMWSCDFSNIEARILPWLAGQDDRLQRYVNGEDIYIFNAANIYHTTVEDITTRRKTGDPYANKQRKAGKVQELACGYQGGEAAVMLFARSQGLVLTKEEIRNIPLTYRKAVPKIVSFWAACQDAAIKAVQNFGEEFKAGERITYQCKMLAGMIYLTSRLPSGRCLYYPRPAVLWVRMKFVNGKRVSAKKLPKEPTESEMQELRKLSADDQATVDRERQEAFAAGLDYKPTIYYMIKPALEFFGNIQGNTWGMVSTYGGKLAENNTQGTAGCFLHYCAPRIIAKGFQITMKVHDEIVGPATTDVSMQEVENTMAERPPWALDFPLAAVASSHQYYTKE